MARIFKSLAICALVAGCTTAQPPSGITPVPNLVPASFSYDVEGGEFESLRREVPCGVNAVTATVQIDDLHPNPHWSPLAGIVLNTLPRTPGPPNPPNNTVISLRIFAHADNHPGVITFVKGTGPKLTNSLRFDTPSYMGKGLPLTMSWSMDGVVTASVAHGEQLTIAMGGPITSVAFITSGAKAQFTDVQIGHDKSGVPCAPADGKTAKAD